MKEADLARFAQTIAEANAMATADAAVGRDTGTCVLGAGVAVYVVPKGCRVDRRRILIDAPFQGNVGSRIACTRALEHLRSAGLDVFWHDGRMD